MQNLQSLASETEQTESPIFVTGNRVRVTSYGPFRGLKGTIQTVNSLPHLDEPFCFYHIRLEGASIKEPIWFEQDEVESI